MATITTLEGLGSRRAGRARPLARASLCRVSGYFGDVAADRAKVEAQLVIQQTHNSPPTRQGFITGGTVDWGALYVAFPDWARAAYASINQGALDPDSFPTIDAWMQKYGRPTEDPRAQEAAGRAMQEAQNRAMEESRARAEENRIRAEAEMRARALAAKDKAHKEEQARLAAEAKAKADAEAQARLNETGKTGPGLLPPVSTTPAPLVSTPASPDVVTEPGEATPPQAGANKFVIPLLAFGLAYLALKG